MSDPTTDLPPADGKNGLLGRLAKGSFLIPIIAAMTAGLGSYYALQQTVTVASATLQLQITDLKARIEEQKIILNGVVPRQEHLAVEAKQKEIDYWRDKYYQSRIEELEREIKKPR